MSSNQIRWSFAYSTVAVVSILQKKEKTPCHWTGRRPKACRFPRNLINGDIMAGGGGSVAVETDL